MDALVFANFHGRIELPKRSPEVIFLLGDISYPNVDRIDASYHCPKFGVFGNHDGPDYFDDTDIINVHGRRETFHALVIGGWSGCLRYNSKSFGQFTEDDTTEGLRAIGQTDIFIAHGNPRYDSPTDLTHAGFQAYNDHIEHWQPKDFFHGHIHDPFTVHRGRTTVHSVFQVALVTI